MGDVVDKTCASYWLPKLQQLAAKGYIRIPRTKIVEGTRFDFLPGLEGKTIKGLCRFVQELHKGARRLGGYPIFLRTGHTSSKHGWKDTCHVPRRSKLGQHVWKIVEFSAMADFVGLPTDVWLVREMLPVKPAFHAFNGLPVTRERRYFISDGKVVHHLPYWPEDAIRNADNVHWVSLLAELNHEGAGEVEELTELTGCVARAFDGAWSVDWLWTDRGWYLIDMAEAHKSWGCPEELQAKGKA